MNIKYYINNVDIATLGVYVSASEGILNRPSRKEIKSQSYNDEHGVVVDLSQNYIDKREITLTCFIKADDKATFINNVQSFENLFSGTGLQRLRIEVDGCKPLVYDVYLDTAITIKKTWNENDMVGTFSVKLIEPNPVKKVYKYIRSSAASATATVTISTTKCVDITWGDGSATFDVVGSSQSITHDYTSNGTYYIVVAGDIDNISSISVNGTELWNKL